jgi:hypothetical protein
MGQIKGHCGRMRQFDRKYRTDKFKKFKGQTRSRGCLEKQAMGCLEKQDISSSYLEVHEQEKQKISLCSIGAASTEEVI